MTEHLSALDMSLIVSEIHLVLLICNCICAWTPSLIAYLKKLFIIIVCILEDELRAVILHNHFEKTSTKEKKKHFAVYEGISLYMKTFAYIKILGGFLLLWIYDFLITSRHNGAIQLLWPITNIYNGKWSSFRAIQGQELQSLNIKSLLHPYIQDVSTACCYTFSSSQWEISSAQSKLIYMHQYALF
jgi:hypothetical protein